MHLDPLPAAFPDTPSRTCRLPILRTADFWVHMIVKLRKTSMGVIGTATR